LSVSGLVIAAEGEWLSCTGGGEDEAQPATSRAAAIKVISA
jgi:hypothetical protein